MCAHALSEMRVRIEESSSRFSCLRTHRTFHAR
jgi:hypothetical protein